MCVANGSMPACFQLVSLMCIQLAGQHTSAVVEVKLRSRRGCVQQRSVALQQVAAVTNTRTCLEGP